MLRLQRPSPRIVQRFQQTAELDSFSYRELRATLNDALPSGYNIDHTRVRLGLGRNLFARARIALTDWKMFDIDWAELMHPSSHGCGLSPERRL